MSRNTVTPEQQARKAERAARFRTVREALGLTQPAFAERLNDAARTLRLGHASYDVGDITTRENGRRELDIEDYLLASYVDPHMRTWVWLAFGREVVMVPPLNIPDTPIPKETESERDLTAAHQVSISRRAAGTRGRRGT